MYFVLQSVYLANASDELTNDLVFKAVLEKNVLVSQPTVLRFFNRMDEDTLNQFFAVDRIMLRKKIYSIQMPEAVIFLQPILDEYLKDYPEIKLLFRGDSGFATPELYKQCEENGNSVSIPSV